MYDIFTFQKIIENLILKMKLSTNYFKMQCQYQLNKDFTSNHTIDCNRHCTVNDVIL